MKKLVRFGTVLRWKMKIVLTNPKDELSRSECLTFLWSWILRWVPKSVATQASFEQHSAPNKLCSVISENPGS